MLDWRGNLASLEDQLFESSRSWNIMVPLNIPTPTLAPHPRQLTKHGTSMNLRFSIGSILLLVGASTRGKWQLLGSVQHFQICGADGCEARSHERPSKVRVRAFIRLTWSSWGLASNLEKFGCSWEVVWGFVFNHDLLNHYFLSLLH